MASFVRTSYKSGIHIKSGISKILVNFKNKSKQIIQFQFRKIDLFEENEVELDFAFVFRILFNA